MAEDLANIIRFSQDYKESIGPKETPGSFLSAEVCEYLSGSAPNKIGLSVMWWPSSPCRPPKGMDVDKAQRSVQRHVREAVSKPPPQGVTGNCW